MVAPIRKQLPVGITFQTDLIDRFDNWKQFIQKWITKLADIFLMLNIYDFLEIIIYTI